MYWQPDHPILKGKGMGWDGHLYMLSKLEVGLEGHQAIISEGE